MGVVAGMDRHSFGNIEGALGAPTGAVSNSALLGARYGIVVTLPFNSHFALEPELHYSKGGTRLETSNDLGRQRVDAVLTYVELPVLLRYDMTSTAAVRPFFVGGGSIGQRIDCRLANNQGGFAGKLICSDLPKGDGVGDPFIHNDARAIVGAGLVTTRGERAVSMQLRWNQGVVNVSRNGNYPDFRPRTRALSLLFGVSTM